MKNVVNQSVRLEGNEYYKGFKEFLARTDQKQISINWLKKQFRRQRDIRRILSIGCGEGEFDLEWLKLFPNVITYIGIEPNSAHLSAFRQRLQNDTHSKKMSIRFVQEGFEYVDMNERFDLICISQSLYYQRDKQAALNKAFELLDVNGELVIFHTKGNYGIDSLKNLFHSCEYQYTCENLINDLKEIHLPFKSEVLPSKIQIKEFPKSLLAFMLERPVSEEEYQQAISYLAKNYPDGILPHPLLAIHITSGFSDEAYKKHYKKFRSLTDTVSVIKKWMQNFLTTVDRPIQNVLSIGCGNGQIDTECLLEPLDSISLYTGLDPNTEHLQTFRERLTSHTKARVALLPTLFEDFHSDQRYDLIIMSHVLYYIPQRKFALSKACTLLSEKGTLIIFHQTERGINTLQKRYGRTRYSYNSFELGNDLDMLEIPYRYEELDSYVNIGELSDTLIRFFLEGEISQWQAMDARQYLSHKYPEKRMHHPIGTFVVSAHNFNEMINARLLSDSEYAKCFEDFLHRSNQHNKIIQWLQKQCLMDLNSIERMLSVGCGTGAFDLQFAQHLPNLRGLTFIDPNQDHLSTLEKNISEASLPFMSHIEAGNLETYHSKETFDLIMLAHSLYYVKNLSDIIKRAVQLLSEKGKLLIFHEPPYGGMHRLHKQMGIFGRVSMTSQHIEDCIQTLALDYQIDVIPVALDLREITDLIIQFLLERNPTQAEFVEARFHLLNMIENNFIKQDTVAIIVQRVR